MWRRELLKNKLYAIAIIFLGALSVPIERDATFFLFALMMGIMLFFSKENWIMQEVEKMTPNEYQKLAMRTCSIPCSQKKAMIYHAVFGLTSEAGEVAGIFQKEYQGHEIDGEHIKRELGDCLWMIAEACTALDFDLEDVMAVNIEKLYARYPEGFDPDHSLHKKAEDL